MPLKLAGKAQSRSPSQQVAHWARIGREIEASPAISQRDIAEVLAGARTCDSLTPKEQAVVRAEWTARMAARREALDLAAKFVEAERSWVELDDDGRVVERNVPNATATNSTKAAGGAATRKASKGATASAKGVGTSTECARPIP